MLRLSDDEKRVLEGRQGRLKQVCLENIVRYAEILGAAELCEVTKATVFCGAHNYLQVCGSSSGFDEVFSRMNLAAGTVIAFDRTDEQCAVQSDVSPCEHGLYEPFGQSGRQFRRNAHFLQRAREAGVTIAGTCAPYLSGWIPVQGEHFVTTESSVTVMGNSVWGAMGNSDGIEAAFWSAICGRTPKWGKHLQENRSGTQLFQVQAQIGGLVEWDLLGKAIGERLPTGGVPVICGEFARVTLQKLRQLCTTLAISSNCEMCHVVGHTPEAPTAREALRAGSPVEALVIEQAALREAYESVCAPDEGPVGLVSLGCPHYDIDQIRRAARALDGRKVHPGVQLMIWTAYPIKCLADDNGYTRVIEEAGGRLYSGSCPVTIGTGFLRRFEGLVFDSLKQAAAARSEVDKPVYFGEAARCIEAAVAGRWEGSHRWPG